MSNSMSHTSFPGVSILANALHEYVGIGPSFSVSSVVVLEVTRYYFSSFKGGADPIPCLPFSNAKVPYDGVGSYKVYGEVPTPSPILLSTPSTPQYHVFSGALETSSAVPYSLPP